MEQFISLMYHNVCRTQAEDGVWPGFADLSPSITSYFVDRETFARHCQILVEHACQSSSQIGRNTRTGIQITFDDGWRGTFDVAGPILAAHGLTAIAFVTTDLIGHPDFADAATLASASPTFTIGSHARSHRMLGHLSLRDIREELAGSKQVLEEFVGYEVDQLAFPGGSFDRRILEIARELGYRTFYTSLVRSNRVSATDDLIGRVAIRSGTSDADLRRYLAGKLAPERWRQMALTGLRRLLGRRGYAAVRAKLLNEEPRQREMTDLAAETPVHHSDSWI